VESDWRQENAPDQQIARILPQIVSRNLRKLGCGAKPADTVLQNPR
jgi:hypothetical protein